MRKREAAARTGSVRRKEKKNDDSFGKPLKKRVDIRQEAGGYTAIFARGICACPVRSPNGAYRKYKWGNNRYAEM